MVGTPRWILPPWLRGGAVIQASLALLACVVPEHMHVTEGVSSRNSGTNVRFRTTYYFRVFDICWAANADIVIATGEGGQTAPRAAISGDCLLRPDIWVTPGRDEAIGPGVVFKPLSIEIARFTLVGATR